MPSPPRVTYPCLLCLLAGAAVQCGGASPNAGPSADQPPSASQSNSNGGSRADASVGAVDELPDAGTPVYEGSIGSVIDATRAPPPVVDDAGNPLPLFAADSSPVRASDCKPGTYSGPFDTMVTIMGGGDASVFEWTGMLSITLVANNSAPQFGEFNSTVLTVAPGAHISGTDNLDGMFDGDISGQLDCASRMFVGTISNGTYSGLSVFFTGSTTVMLVGSLTGTYDPTANPLALANGSMTVSSPQVGGFEADGSWSAVLQ